MPELKKQMKISGCKNYDVKGGWRKLRNDDLHNLYTSPNVRKKINSRRIRMVRHVARTRTTANVHQVFDAKLEGNKIF